MKKILIGVIFLCVLWPTSNVLAAPNGDGNVSDLFENQENNDSNDVEETPEENQATTDEEESSSDESVVGTDQSLFLDFLKMVVALVVVLGLIYFLLKFLQKRTRIYQQTRALENFGGLSLGSNKSVQIIRVGNEYYLIGVGDEVQLLDRIESKETIENLHSTEESTNQSLNFQDLLKKFSNRDKNPYHQDQNMTTNFQNEFDQMRKERAEILSKNDQKEDRRHD